MLFHVAHRPTQTSAPTGADIRIDRRRCYYCLLLLSVVQIYVL